MKLIRLVFCGWLLTTGVPFHAQESVRDTARMDEAEVLSIRIPTPMERAAASVATLKASDLQNGYSPDLQDALNTLPGVQMDTRGLGGSRRLQIRSSGLRSPFGVRNIQMVMDGFMLSNASGNAPLELWNPQWMHRLEVLRGPIGAVFGNGYGGALIAESLPNFDEMKSEIRGYGRFAEAQESGFSFTSAKGKGALVVRAFWADNPGFRDQEANQKQQAEIHYLFQNSPQTKQHIWTGWMQARWELPGSLNANDANLDPKLAPGADYDAHVFRDRRWAAWSVVQEKRARTGFWLYGQSSQKSNPFGTSRSYNGDKEENERFLSARYSRIQSWPVRESGKFTWELSSTARLEQFRITERDLFGASGVHRYDIESGTNNLWLAQSGRFEFGDGWQLDAQLALEYFGRDSEGTRRVFDGFAESLAPYFEAYSGWKLNPFAQLSYNSGPRTMVFVQFATGTNHPTSFELVEPISFAPSDLTAEFAESWESGVRWHARDSKFQAHAALLVYHQNVRNAIALIPGPADGLFMSNVDGLVMNGLELNGRFTLAVGAKSLLDLRYWGNVNRHAFRPYADIVPGTPLHTAGSASTLRRGRLSMGWQHEWYDRVKLHNDKDDWSAPHHRLNAFISMAQDGQRWQVGVRNLLNAQFSSWLQTNAFGGKYFNPSPERQLWLSWSWSLSS